MRFLSLFAGIGGFDLGLERAGMECVGQVEIDPFCQKVLAKHWPGVSRHDDIRTFKPERGSADLVCGGFPCQPFSAAGKRRGTEDDRHLWPEMARVIAEVRPAWVVGENVTGIIGLALDGVLSDLEGMGYAIWPVVLPACAVDAPHRRDRIWIVGYSEGARLQRRERKECAGRPEFDGSGSDVAHPSRVQQGRQEQRPIGERVGECGQSIDVADADQSGPQGRDSAIVRERAGERVAGPGGASMADTAGDGWQQRRAGADEPRETGRLGSGCWWLPEPGVGRVAHGVPRRVDRLRSLGNAVVPQIPEIIGRAIMTSALTRKG